MNQQPTVRPDPLHTLAMVGRERELQSLRSRLAATGAGQGCFVAIGGEAGIGKTTLVRQFVSEATAAGAVALAGNCYDFELTPPYGPWIDLAGAAVGADWEALREHLSGTAASGETAPVALHAVLWHMVQHQARDRTVVLVLEDMHWADQASLDLLRIVVRRVSTARLMVVLTYRDVELEINRPLYRLLPQLVREGAAIRLSLRQLDDDAISALVRLRFALPEADVTRLVGYLHHISDGNPFYVEELLSQLIYDDLLRETRTGWVLGDVARARTPLLIRQALGGRLDALSDDARAQLQLAAVIGSDISLALWQELAGLDEDTLATAVEEGLSLQLLVDVPGRDLVRFRHALIRQALYEQLSIVRRRAWHRRVAEALERQRVVQPETIASHYQMAHDPRAIDWLLLSGRRAARAVAHRDAMAAFEAADLLLEQTTSPEQQRTRAWLQCELAEVHGYTDARVALQYLAVAQRLMETVTDEALRVVVLWQRGRLRGLLGEAALEDVEAAIAAFGQLSAEDRERVLHGPIRVIVSQGPHAYWLAHHGRFKDAVRIANAFLLETEGRPDALDYRERGMAHFARGIAHAGLGQPEQALDDFVAVRVHFRQADSGRVVAVAADWEYDTLLHPYYPERSAEQHRTSPDTASNWMRLAAGPDSAPRITSPLCDALIRSGAWAEAREVAGRLGHADVQRANSSRTLAEIYRLTGQPERAWAHIRAVLPAGPESPPGTLYFLATLELLHIAVELALDAADAPLARQWLATRQRWLDWSAGIVLGRASQTLLTARLHLLEGNLDLAREAALTALDLASQPRQPLALLAAHRQLAELDLLQRRFDAARQHLDNALYLATTCDAAWEQAATRLVLAELQFTLGQHNEARQTLSDARQRAIALGAQPLVAAIDTLVRAQGASITDDAARFGLSQRELEVLRLVTQGMTDAQIGEQLFISSRTVSGHMQSIFNKLGVSSRTAATAFAFERGLI
jgi:DNA-binding CsgD family transcriptional regulator/tetratricopeptide (TPR) repeat protein